MDLFYTDLVAANVDAPGVVPRDWLFAEVQTRLLRPNCRFVLLVGEPGAGKTGLMAALARSNAGWLRYFIRSDSTTPLSDGDAVSMMLRIGHQLAHHRPEIFDPQLLEIVVNQRVQQAGAGATVTGVKIDDLKVSPFYKTAIRVQQNIESLSGGLIGVEIARATAEPRLLELGTLSQLALLDPAAALAREQPHEMIVVLVDALDELFEVRGTTTILDWLETCPELPPNLRFVLSSRPHARLRTLESIRGTALEIFPIKGDSVEVTQDVRLFAAKLFDDTKALTNRPAINQETAVSSLCEAAEGNFAYLAAYARSLRAALSSSDAETLDELLGFEALPTGLYPLYAAFARRVRRQIEKLGQLEVASPRGPGDEFVPAWEGVGQRFLGVLTVARAPLTLNQLIALGAIRAWNTDANNVLQWIVPFLDEAGSEWKLFHPSLGEFLRSADRHDASDIAIDAREWHMRIVRYYQHGVSWADVDWRTMDSYGLLHLGEHLFECSDETTAVSQLVTFGLRVAMKERFRSDLPFRKVVETALGNARLAQTIDTLLTETVFLELVLSCLSSSAAQLDPAVYGLMARLGRVEEALARIEVRAPGLHKYRSLEAVWNSTPAEKRGELGKADGVERLVSAALEVPSTASGLVGFLGMDRTECLREAALAMAPHDLERALVLAEMEPGENPAEERDAVLAAAALAAAPEAALDLIARMGQGKAKAAADRAESASPGPARDKLIAFAELHVEGEEKAEDRLRVLSQILSIRRKDGQHPDRRSEELRASIAQLAQDLTGSESNWSWTIIDAAKRLHETEPELAVELLRRCDPPEVDSSSDWMALSAAEVWASWNRGEECRRLLEKALAFFRSLNWYGPARDIARAAVIASSIDASWGQDLANEAISLVEPNVEAADEFEQGRLAGILAGIVGSFRPWDRARALRVARWIPGSWVHGGPWDSTDGRGSAMALIGLDAANDDPTLSAQLLTECLAQDEVPVRLGRTDAYLIEFGLFRPVGTMSATQSRYAEFITYVTNSVNYWIQGRKSRFFVSPADVLRSLDFDFPATASWARTVASAVAPIAALDLDRAVALASWLADPGERLVAFAALAEAFDGAGDVRLDRTLRALRSAAAALPQYEPGVDLEKISQGPVLRYSDATVRARFEAAILLPVSGHAESESLIQATDSWYIGMVWQAEKIFQDLISGVFGNMPAKEFESEIGAVVEKISQDDDLVGDLLCFGCALALVQHNRDGADAWIRRISNPTIRANAMLCCLPFAEPPGATLVEQDSRILNELPEDVSPLHRAELAAITIDICKDHGADASTLLQWGLSSIQDAGPRSETRGLIALSRVAEAPQCLTLLARALRLSDHIGNVYLRNDALVDLFRSAVTTADGQLITLVIHRLIQSGWRALMEALRRAMPQTIETAGPGIVELLDTAMRKAQTVVGSTGELPNPSQHLDGVLAVHLRNHSLDALFPEPPEIDPTYLSLYLDQADLWPSLKCVQDSRSKGPDPGDEPFLRLHGRQSGLVAWVDEDDQTLWRFVDIRFLFDNPSDASTYHRERLNHNSEGRPEVKGALPVGDDCVIFGGTEPLPFSEGEFSLTSFYYIFRVENVVAKLFAAQGQAAKNTLTPEHLFPLARRAAERIRSAVGASEQAN